MVLGITIVLLLADMFAWGDNIGWGSKGLLQKPRAHLKASVKGLEGQGEVKGIRWDGTFACRPLGIPLIKFQPLILMVYPQVCAATSCDGGPGRNAGGLGLRPGWHGCPL